MTSHIISLLILPIALVYSGQLFPNRNSINEIVDFSTVCDSQYFNISLSLKQHFKGVAFAKDFAQECKSFGTLTNSIFISLPSSGCGVRLTSIPNDDGTPRLFYSIVLVLQQDKYLRQISDQEKFIKCEMQDDDFLIRRPALINGVNNDLKKPMINHRGARLMKDISLETSKRELKDSLSAARAWMELVPESKRERSFGIVEVGETLQLSIKSTLPAEISWKVVDCMAHDGLGDSSQKLLDENGCPVDEMLLPIPKFGPVRSIGAMKHQEATARFAAFKFPDRDRLHFQCKLQICKGICHKVDCTNDTIDKRVGRASYSDEVLDKLDVFNSVEVISPEIDDSNDIRNKMQSAEFDSYPFPKIPGDKAFCVSVDKMATSFCILGIIFLIAIILACSMLKSRKTLNGTHLARSLFSNSSGTESAFGSKLLLEDSPVFGQSTLSNSSRLHYGRIQ